jgi:RNA polymerase sigma factor (sigma-70 family)
VDSDDSGADLLPALARRSLTPEQERHLFLRLNYCRYRVMRILRTFRGKPLSARAVRELLHWERRTTQTRSDIVRLNVALVLAMAKRTKLTGVDYADLVSEGNLALLRSVDKFDCARGFKFSTYACRAILKSFSRVATRTARYRGHFPTEFDPMLEKGCQVEHKRQTVEKDCVDELKSILGENLARLNDVEQRVIRARFAIEDQPDETDMSRAKTLEQVGEMIGVTKERVRQIQNKALIKLRVALEQGILAS